MFKSYYTLESVLRAAAEGRELNDEQREVIQRKLDKDEERAKQQAIMRKLKKASFEQEIMQILEAAPNTGFAATDVQFLIRDFVNRRITNQKVASCMHDLLTDGRIKRAYINHYRMTVFYCGDNLVDICHGYPIRSIDEIRGR